MWPETNYFQNVCQGHHSAEPCMHLPHSQPSPGTSATLINQHFTDILDSWLMHGMEWPALSAIFSSAAGSRVKEICNYFGWRDSSTLLMGPVWLVCMIPLSRETQEYPLHQRAGHLWSAQQALGVRNMTVMPHKSNCFLDQKLWNLWMNTDRNLNLAHHILSKATTHWKNSVACLQIMFLHLQF